MYASSGGTFMPTPTAATLPEGYQVALGRAVRAAREGANLGVIELARKAGISRAMVAFIEAGGRSGSLPVLYALASALGSSPGRLLRAAEKNLEKSAT
jgi:transcriptional regulator with XRE-family HTH domain